MRSVEKTRLRPAFSTEFCRVFGLDPPVGILSRKKVSRKSPFFDCVRKPNLGFSRKRPFSTDESDRIGNGFFFFFFSSSGGWEEIKL